MNARNDTGRANENIQLLDSTGKAITLEVHLPVDQLVEKTVVVEGKEYINLSVPGWQQLAHEGEPRLPVITETLGVPFGVDFTLQIDAGGKHIRTISHPILPEMTPSIDWEGMLADLENFESIEPRWKRVESQKIYQGDDLFPGSLAEVTGDGVIRDQRVIGLSIYPIQYTPATGELILYESLKITIKFNGSQSSISPSSVSDSAVYDNLFQDLLLNYETALRWRQEPASINPDSTIRSVPWSPPDPGWRISLRETGFYKLSYDQLDAAGFPVDQVNPQTFQLFNRGVEVAVQVIGEADGTFDPADGLIFFGQEIDSKYTADNIYWLTYGSSTQGIRIGTRDVSLGAGDIPLSYPASRHFEENLIYWSTAPGGEEIDRWLWQDLLASSSQSWSYTFSIPDYEDGPGAITIMLLGYLQNPINPDHHLRIYLQNASEPILVGESWWDGINWELMRINLDPGILQPGENTIIIEIPVDTGVGFDWVFIDWINLQYPRKFTAVENHLSFKYEKTGCWNFQLQGFTESEGIVFDVTEPAAVQRLSGAIVDSAESSYSLKFTDTLSGPRNYWAMAGEEFLSVQKIEKDRQTNLLDITNGAEHLIITHGAFSAQAEALQLHRESQGLVSRVVDVQDIYDSFNFGIVDIYAIRDFLAYTLANWDPYPSYVLLFGDGHYNPKGFNLAKYDDWQEAYIPPYLAPIDPIYLETAADNRYVTLVGDDLLPDMMLGRLAVNNPDEADAVIDKILTYENAPPPGDWRNQILAVTDNYPDNAGNFYLISDSLLDCCLPGPFTAQKIYFKKTHLTLDEARQALQDGINAGKLIVNYIGHASTSQWADEGLFKRTDVDGLSNGDRMPIILSMTCSDGYYIHPGSTQPGVYPSVAETITRAAGKGAVASWSATGWGNVSGHDLLNRGFLDKIFQSGDGRLTLGSAALSGKINLFSSGANMDLLDTYLLFGDPATRIVFDFTGVDDTYTIEEDHILEVSGGLEGKKGVLSNDIHPENRQISALLVDDVSSGALTLHPDGSFVYIPDSDFDGLDSFTYYADDGEENSNLALVEIHIEPVDEKLFLPLVISDDR